ncbi:hypothetical protein ABZ807_19580 [Micromonospora sp. NPDC047548]|uniref:hypothetical protein n=1 Tax=Micromonospora sp. NPDC047548 TaxID=3155624 RepID=UPI0033C661B5
MTVKLLPGHGQIEVRLSAVARDGGPAYRWLGIFDTPPVSTLPVVLGVHDDAFLLIDLAMCPDVFTVTGKAEDLRPYVAGLTRQLLAYRHPVHVVGDVLGSDLPDGCVVVDEMPELGEGDGRTEIVISGALPARALATARTAIRSGSRTALVVVGDVLPSRWSVAVRPVGPEAAPAAASAGTP